MTEKQQFPPFQILILSCDAFSDIWEINCAFLKQNWKESLRNASLVTEISEPDFASPIRIVHTGKQAYADKVQLALEEIQSPYVILLLDDYLLTKRIDQKEIESVLLEAAENNADYIRFDRFRGEKKKKGSKHLYSMRPLGSRPYQVNMEPSLWKTSSLRKMLHGQKTAWELEVSLTEEAKRCDLRCFSTKKKILPYLDTIRKGKILHRAWKTVKQSPYYHGNREKCPLKNETRLFLISVGKALTPYPLQKAIKRWLVKRGHRYYSNWEQQ